MRRGVTSRSSGGPDKKSTSKVPKLRSSSRILDQHIKANMPVYNIIARRHKVMKQISNISISFYALSISILYNNREEKKTATKHPKEMTIGY